MKPVACSTAAFAAVTLMISSPAALAAAPGNDERMAPAAIGALPAQVSGTTVDATRQTTDPPSGCGVAGTQVWYRFTAPGDGRVAVRLSAAGDQDAALDAYLSERSQTRPLGCDLTDSKGLGAVDFAVEAGASYLLSVTRLPNSVAGPFRLTVVAPQKPERPPGSRLPAGGADGTLDRVGNIQDAYAVRLREGRTYRFRLSGRGEDACTVAGALYAPRADAFEGSSLRSFGCDEDGYATYTPDAGEGGVYSVLVSAGRTTRTLQRYHFEAAGAGVDDTSPGRFLTNRVLAKGTLDGARIDALDLYRFTVARRSDLDLRLSTQAANNFDLVLLDDRGRRVQCQCGSAGKLKLTRRLAAGRYFVAVRARDRSAGRYAVRRTSRLLTRTSVAVDRRRATLGGELKIAVRVRPEVNGPITVRIQRFDPLDGWLFHRLARARTREGRASVRFRPPTVGRWRVRAMYDGTLGAGPSMSGFAEALVVARKRAG